MPDMPALFPAIHGVEYLAIFAIKGDVMKPKLTKSNGSDSFGFRLRQAGWWNSLKIQYFEQRP